MYDEFVSCPEFSGCHSFALQYCRVFVLMCSKDEEQQTLHQPALLLWQHIAQQLAVLSFLWFVQQTFNRNLNHRPIDFYMTFFLYLRIICSEKENVCYEN